jgi:hypothetical protein
MSNSLPFLSIYDHYLENNHNNALQVRPSIPRRPSLTRLAAAQNLLVTSQVHHQQEQPQQQQKQQKSQPKRQFDSEIENDEGIDSAIESRSLSINTSDDGVPEVILFFYSFIEKKKVENII